MLDLLLRLSRRRLAHELWKHLRRRLMSAVHDQFKTSGIGWPMNYVSYRRSLCGYVEILLNSFSCFIFDFLPGGLLLEMCMPK
jgi:hypothetical protein